MKITKICQQKNLSHKSTQNFDDVILYKFSEITRNQLMSLYIYYNLHFHLKTQE